MIKIGETAFLKTTGEVVYILDIHATGAELRALIANVTIFSEEALVRIPILSAGGGISHDLATFLVEELETAQEKFDRELEQFTQLQKRQPLRPLEDDPKKVIN